MQTQYQSKKSGHHWCQPHAKIRLHSRRHVPTNTNKAKTNIARATGLMAAGTCATSVLRWVLRAGQHRTQSADPRVRIQSDQVKAWTGIWNRATDEI